MFSCHVMYAFNSKPSLGNFDPYPKTALQKPQRKTFQVSQVNYNTKTAEFHPIKRLYKTVSFSGRAMHKFHKW